MWSLVTLVTVSLAAAASAPHRHIQGAHTAANKKQYCYGLYPKGAPCPIEFATFDQLIDHDTPSLGTFKQRYWVNPEFYAGRGAPIVLSGPGESAADRSIWYTTNETLDGTFAQEIKGAAIVLEHRYWGDSSPFDRMNTKNMRYLTLDNAMRDIIYFARNVRLSFDVNGTTHPDRAPWVFSGGSYPGAMAAWINKLYPDYWQYYVPIEEAMPRNCSKDMKLAIEYIDNQLSTRNGAGKRALKARFGLASLQDDDFGSALTAGLQSVGGNSTNRIPGEEGVGACKAASGLAKWFREVVVPGSCEIYGNYWKDDPTTIACWDTHNLTSPFFTDRSVRNQWNLQWQWMLCNEPFQQWQASAPGDTGLVSKHFTMQDLRDQCERFFPDEDGYTYGLKRGRTTEDIVRLTDGWNNVNTTRLVYVNGEYDPWLPETVSSPFRPDGPLNSTPDVPVFVVPKAAHCPDLVMNNTFSNEELHQITQCVITIVAGWVAEFYKEKGVTQPGFKA